MKYIGRILGVILGLRFGGFFGALFGFWLGLLLDRKLNLNPDTYSHEEKQRVFFDATFLVMGHVAKADGVVSKHEINQANQVMRHLNLSAKQTRQAQALFNQGKSSDFDMDATLAEVRNVIGPRNSLSMMFLEIQISSALADGTVNPEERAILLKIASSIGVPQAFFEQLVNMIAAAQNLGGSHGGAYNDQTDYASGLSRLDQAYQTLGIAKNVSDAAVKKAYRKLMSEHHPDKLQAKGLPDEMIKIAADKAQAINKAYDLIKETRRFK